MQNYPFTSFKPILLLLLIVLSNQLHADINPSNNILHLNAGEGARKNVTVNSPGNETARQVTTYGAPNPDTPEKQRI